jgi:hypothetical protein
VCTYYFPIGNFSCLLVLRELTGKDHVPDGHYDLAWRNCQTTTKDLAKLIIGESDWDPKFKWPLDSSEVLSEVVYGAAFIGCNVPIYKGATYQIPFMEHGGSKTTFSVWDIIRSAATVAKELAELSWQTSLYLFNNPETIQRTYQLAKELAELCWQTSMYLFNNPEIIQRPYQHANMLARLPVSREIGVGVAVVAIRWYLGFLACCAVFYGCLYLAWVGVPTLSARISRAPKTLYSIWYRKTNRCS